jgi:hypothetical protein
MLSSQRCRADDQASVFAYEKPAKACGMSGATHSLVGFPAAAHRAASGNVTSRR